MKKYLKTFLIATIAVFMIASVAVLAAGCADTSKYEMTVVTEDGSPLANEKLFITFCPYDDPEGVCLTLSTDENGKATADLTKYPGDTKEFSIHIPTSYTFADGTNEKVVDLNDGYSITLEVKAK